MQTDGINNQENGQRKQASCNWRLYGCMIEEIEGASLPYLSYSLTASAIQVPCLQLMVTVSRLQASKKLMLTTKCLCLILLSADDNPCLVAASNMADQVCHNTFVHQDNAVSSFVCR